MQPESIAAIIGIIGSLFATGISYGIMNAKVNRLEREMDKVDDRYVPIDLFHATINPIREDMHEMRQDIKKILSAVQKTMWGTRDAD